MATLLFGSKKTCPVKVKKSTTNSLKVVPSTSIQTFSNSNPGYGKINILAPSSDIDNNLVSKNIKKDVTILNVKGTYQPITTKAIYKQFDRNNYLQLTGDLIDLSGITTIGNGALYRAYIGNTAIPNNIDLSDIKYVNEYGMAFCFYADTNIDNINLSGLTSILDYGFRSCFQGCTGLTKISFDNLKIVSIYGLSYCFYNCTNLEEAELNELTSIGNAGGLYTFRVCSNLKKVGLKNLTSIGRLGCQYMFRECSSLSSMIFPSLSKIDYQGLNNAFYNCTNLKHIAFPALTADSFNGYTNSFYQMLRGVTGCTVHFPVTLESAIGNWSDVQDGFNGTNTTVLFDLPAFLRDTSTDLVYDSTTDSYMPVTNI